MKLIELSKTSKTRAGQYFAEVDDEDFDELNKFNWNVHFDTHNLYAVRSYSVEMGRQKDIKMVCIPSEHLKG